MFSRSARARRPSGGEQRPASSAVGSAASSGPSAGRAPSRSTSVDRPTSSPTSQLTVTPALDPGPAVLPRGAEGRRAPGLSCRGMARRLSSPVFVGRSNELADAPLHGRFGRLRPCLDHRSSAARRASARPGSSASCAARLRDRDWLVLEGGSVALGDDGLPFGPIVEALRALVREVDPERIATAAGASLPELARLVPELVRRRRVRPDRRAPGGVAPGPHLRGRAPAARPARRDDARSCSSSRTSTGPTGRPATCSPSSPATPATSGCSSSPRSGPTSCTAVIR